MCIKCFLYDLQSFSSAFSLDKIVWNHFMTKNLFLILHKNVIHAYRLTNEYLFFGNHKAFHVILISLKLFQIISLPIIPMILDCGTYWLKIKEWIPRYALTGMKPPLFIGQNGLANRKIDWTSVKGIHRASFITNHPSPSVVKYHRGMRRLSWCGGHARGSKLNKRAIHLGNK